MLYIKYYKNSSNPKELFTKAILDKNYDFYILELSKEEHGKVLFASL